MQNRAILREFLPSEPLWLNQEHTNNIANLIDYPDTINQINNNPFDGVITSIKNQVLCIMTADCVPILLTNTAGCFIGAIHAGWRGVAGGIVTKCINALKSINPESILVYLGQSICKKHFEVGQDLYNIMLNINHDNKQFFSSGNNSNKYYCDLIGIVILQLLNSGVLNTNITLSNSCTYCNANECYSYRRDGVTGRQASLIWIGN